MREESRPILGENYGVESSPKITQKRDKNTHDQHLNTLISIKTGEEKRWPFLSPKTDCSWLEQPLSLSLTTQLHMPAFNIWEGGRVRGKEK